MRMSWILAGLLVIPAAGGSTVEKESKGGRVGEIEKEGSGKSTYYEAEIKKGGKESYVHVAESGKVLRRETPAQERRSEGTEHHETTH